MNRIIIFIFFGWVLGLQAPQAKAQGNLQFSRVINYTIASQTVNTNSSTRATFNGNITVPSNKVWKIESVGVYSDNLYWSIFIDRYLVYNNNPAATCKLPLWLPSGTYDWKGLYYSAGAVSVFFEGAAFSIIEFNIVP
jgi:hypothetical protein